MRVGFGYDVHALAEGRALTLGGIKIPYLFGLQGHSDADVLLHAISDALLGAIAEGDIGKYFPDTDPQYKNIRSTILLKKVMIKMREKGFHVLNVDATILAQKPKLSDHISRMVKEIADVLEIETGRVNVKATTSEGLGFVGREEGISAYAVVLVEED
ncbi:MAG: 2-C-methyl-D-erythritol 2,4-cyclodiphosphate synthase [Deltaproteobacteria bacterium RBG_16_47_11]|nr:MAG: 2-C-methyl-D-erythritol 2,4-cyclodiphosphate synthase [Deltaproteobacteria bacterium RBG_16_47_11]